MSQTQQNFIMFIIVLEQHVSILTESSSGPSKKTGPYLECLKMHWIPNPYILDKNIYIMHMHFIHSFIKNVSVWDPVHF